MHPKRKSEHLITVHPVVWRLVVILVGGWHTLGRRDIVVHDRGVVYCTDRIVRRLWRIQK